MTRQRVTRSGAATLVLVAPPPQPGDRVVPIRSGGRAVRGRGSVTRLRHGAPRTIRNWWVHGVLRTPRPTPVPLRPPRGGAGHPVRSGAPALRLVKGAG